MLTTIKWALYARKSTESEERQIHSITDQIGYFGDVIQRENLKVVETIGEAKSAKLPNNRPGFSALIAKIHKGEIDGIICWRLNRLARNPVDGGMISWLLQTGKIKCIKTSERCYYPTDNVLLFAVELGMANQEVRELAKNVANALERKALNGYYPAVPPIGYLNSKWRLKGEERILKDKARFPLVRKMWDLMLTGNYTPSEILRIATTDWKLDTPKRKKKGGKPLNPSAIYKMFTSIFYTGNFVYKGKLYRGKHDAMITPDEFERVQMLLGKKSQPKPIVNQFAYTGIMRCGNCGAAITATEKRKLHKATGTYRNYIYYHCTRRMGIDKCKEPAVTLSDLESQIANLLEENSIGSKFYQLGMEILGSNLKHDTSEQDAIKSKQSSYISETKGKLDRLLSLLVNETISEDDYIRQKKELEEKLLLAKTKLDGLNESDKPIQDQLQNIFHFCHHAHLALRTGDLKTKRSILNALGSNQQLKQKNLYVERHSWLIAIKECEKALTPTIERFELEKTSNSNTQFDFLPFFPFWCGEIEDVRTALTESLNISIPDLKIYEGLNGVPTLSESQSQKDSFLNNPPALQ